MTISDDLMRYKLEPRRSVHSFHRYFGKLIPGIPAWAIERYTNAGDNVLDPFSGSGTTAVEARERGRQAYGIDINGLSTFISRVKTRRIDEGTLKDVLESVLGTARTLVHLPDEPYVVNMDHWFRPEVKIELLRIRGALDALESPEIREFGLGVFSAFLRGVSNADPQHVFPGVSKRMRRLEEEGRKIDVTASFRRAWLKRAKQVSELEIDGLDPTLLTGSILDYPFGELALDLIVTNPPYISSIRYLETMKIEMGWLGFIKSQSEYLSLDRKVIGTERYYKADLRDIPKTYDTELDGQVERIFKTSPKMARVVSEYFNQMLATWEILAPTVRTSGHVVIKIAPSNVRGELLATHNHFTNMLTNLGFRLCESFDDPYDPNSRSLLTARNTYSGIMTSDQVMVFQKV